jgi:hypothetical protein
MGQREATVVRGRVGRGGILALLLASIPHPASTQSLEIARSAGIGLEATSTR